LYEISKIYEEKEALDPRNHLQPIFKEIKNIKTAIENGRSLAARLDEENEDSLKAIEKIKQEKPKLEEKILKYKEKLAKIRNSRLTEMIEIQQAIKALNEKIAEGSVQINELQDNIRKNEERKREIRDAVLGLKKQYNDKVILYNKTKAELDLKIAALTAKEEELKEELSPDVLNILDNTVETVKSKPIALLKDDICTGCCLAVSNHTARLVKRMEKLQCCDNCKRILLPQSVAACKSGDLR